MYKSGDRVRLQNSKSKEWELLGTILDRRLADDCRIVSYLIKTDLGYDTTPHRRFLRPLVEKYAGQHLTSPLNNTAIPSILEGHEVRAEPGE